MAKRKKKEKNFVWHHGINTKIQFNFFLIFWSPTHSVYKQLYDITTGVTAKTSKTL